MKTKHPASLLGNRPLRIHRLPRQHPDDRLQGLVGAPDVPDGALEQAQQALDLDALGADLVVQDGVVGLRRLQAGVEQ
ncbi:hypothetical protein MKX07_000192 [Trichoderma sp. CBMAI-0711]|nr:hypothetical protein MKX07_000192 [Trichoderma sp. CBMAI-0711]